MYLLRNEIFFRFSHSFYDLIVNSAEKNFFIHILSSLQP